MKLGYGSGTVSLDAESDGRYEVVFPEELSGSEDETAEIERALDEPIGPALQDFEGCKSASIMVSDITRPAPSYKMLPPLIERLQALGIEQVKIVFGLGTHRRMTPEEEKRLIGECIFLPHVQHDRDRCVALGETSLQTVSLMLERMVDYPPWVLKWLKSWID